MAPSCHCQVTVVCSYRQSYACSASPQWNCSGWLENCTPRRQVKLVIEKSARSISGQRARSPLRAAQSRQTVLRPAWSACRSRPCFIVGAANALDLLIDTDSCNVAVLIVTNRQSAMASTQLSGLWWWLWWACRIGNSAGRETLQWWQKFITEAKPEVRRLVSSMKKQACVSGNTGAGARTESGREELCHRKFIGSQQQTTRRERLSKRSKQRESIRMPWQSPPSRRNGCGCSSGIPKIAQCLERSHSRIDHRYVVWLRRTDHDWVWSESRIVWGDAACRLQCIGWRNLRGNRRFNGNIRSGTHYAGPEAALWSRNRSRKNRDLRSTEEHCSARPIDDGAERLGRYRHSLLG